MNRIKTRIALLLAATALSSITMAAPVSAAEGGCYPYPEVYCDAMEYYHRCILGPIKYGWEPCNGGSA